MSEHYNMTTKVFVGKRLKFILESSQIQSCEIKKSYFSLKQTNFGPTFIGFFVLF